MAETIEALHERLFGVGVLQLALELHMVANGTLDGVSPQEIKDRERYLCWRLDNWKPSAARNQQFDDAVVQVAQAALCDLGEWKERQR